MSYVPLHIHSFFSLLDGMPSPKAIAKRAKDLGCPAIALTDHGNIAGTVEFKKACDKHGIKPIIGIELYVCLQDPEIRTKENNQRYHLTVLAKNADGVADLRAMVSESNRPDWFYRKPRIDLIRMKPFAAKGNLLCLSGCLGGELSETLFADVDGAHKPGLSMDEIRKCLKPDWMEQAEQIVRKHQDVFGKDNYYIEIQEEGMVSQKVVVECLRKVASALGIPPVATLDSHYLSRDDAEDHRILLCSQLHTTTTEQEQLQSAGKDVMAFWSLDQFYIFSDPEMRKKYSAEEVDNSLAIGELVEAFKPVTRISIPSYPVTEHQTADDYLKSLCIEGAKTKLSDLPPDEKKKYWDRLEYELLVIKEAGLANYFLIVYDACHWIDNNGGLRGAGRGSGAGSLVNYLLGITRIDPILYDLYFERFYNASRNIPPHFNCGKSTFMDWLGENFDRLLKTDPAPFRKRAFDRYTANREKYNAKIWALAHNDIDWIDYNNPKMWIYLCETGVEDAGLDEEHRNKDSSPLAFVLGLTKTYSIDKPIRITERHISLPDIDVDMEVSFREKLIAYLRQKWGEDRVAQMVTFGRLQGRAALKEVFRAQSELVKHLTKVKAVKLKKEPELDIRPVDICNEITKSVPDEAEIADELRQIREETGEEGYGIIQWAIDHVPAVAEFYQWYKPLFDCAMRLEGTKKNSSKHASGLVISAVPIQDLAPMVIDTVSKTRICGFDMGAAEEAGCVKFDWLGVSALDKLHDIQDAVNKGAEK